MITLPTTPRQTPCFRVSYLAGEWASQTWTDLPIPGVLNRSTLSSWITGTVAAGGYQVSSITRACLPDDDRAVFYVDTGTINGAEVNGVSLNDRCVRIQVIDDEQFPIGYTSIASAPWKTVFVGYVFHTENQVSVGETIRGRSTYSCVGVFGRTRFWMLNRHFTATTEAAGHPGYNVPLHGWFRRVLGNKGEATSYVLNDTPPELTTFLLAHAVPGVASSGYVGAWTDSQVIGHALTGYRALGEPYFSLSLGDQYDGTFSWPVNPGDSVHDLVTRICARQRGRGAVFVEYRDAYDQVSLTLRSVPFVLEDLDYQQVPSGGYHPSGFHVISGAKTGGTSVDVDLNGDHRITDGGFMWESNVNSKFDYIEVQGEPIQVCGNLTGYHPTAPTIAQGWNAADQTEFNALTAFTDKIGARWRHVYRRFRLSPSFYLTGKDSDAGYDCSFLCLDSGAISNLTSASAGYAGPSSITLRVLPDLPIYEGWDYSSSPPARFDGSVDQTPPPRMPAKLLWKATTQDAGGDFPAFIPLDLAGFGVQVDDYGVLLTNPIEDRVGYRFFAGKSPVSDAPGGFGVAGLNLVVGLELGTRVRTAYSTGPYSSRGKRLTLTVNGAHLWLGAPDCVFELDYTRASTKKYRPGLAFPPGLPTLIRDDRNALLYIRELAAAFYGSERKAASWALRDCGLLTGFAVQDGAVKEYPTLGKMVGEVTFAGSLDAGERSVTIGTNITTVHYDHDQGQTTWKTDFVQYDGNMQ